MRLKNRNDLVFGPTCQSAAGISQDFQPLKDIHTSSGAGAEWNDCKFSEYGIPGFNEVELRPESKNILTISGKPLLVTWRFDAGQTLAFTGFTPVYMEERAYWNEKIVFPYLVDHVCYEKRVTQSYFSLFMRMIAAATDEKPSTDYDALLELRNKPLFETLKDLPPATISLPRAIRAAVSGNRVILPLNLRNGSEYARLVRARAEWHEREGHAPYLDIYEIYSDNYFDLLPKATKTLMIEVFLPEAHAGKILGTLYVEGTSLVRQEIALELDSV